MTYLTIFLHAGATLGAIILFSRLQGLRTFAKMSGFDFAVTVSFGSILAASVTQPDMPVLVPIAGTASLFVIAMLLAQVRARFDAVDKTLENAPLLVMRGRDVLEENLLKADMTREDLWAKLRQANAVDLDNVFAVVVERNGAVSVLHDDGVQSAMSDELMVGVRT